MLIVRLRTLLILENIRGVKLYSSVGYQMHIEYETLEIVNKYSEARYSRTRGYILLKGYNHAVEKGEIHVLTGFTVYKNIAQEMKNKII